ncbi:MAG TPA: polyketide synthase dehydratase domain-containing protein, partial [Pararhizobium sp.]|nr:polyketide synthase dehydratase domain-containing protein [Pararhizobium sp.]
RIIAHGGAFERARVFGQRQPNTNLPGLTFEQQDVRQDSTSDAIDLYGRGGVPFTLAGWRVDPQGGSWKNHIDAHLYPDLAEHVVDGRSILPGTGFLEIALSAARQFLGADRIEISGMEILHPLELSRETLSELSTIISPDTGAIEIRSRERLGGGDWTLHAKARARRLKIDAMAAPKTAIRSGSAIIERAAAYAAASRFRLDYGPKFRLLRQAVRHGESQIDLVLDAPAAPAHPYLAYTLDPVSVDATFHGLIAAFSAPGDDEGAPFVPIRFGRVRLHAVGQVIDRASVVIRRAGASSVKADFVLFGHSGEVVAALSDCRFKRTYLRRPRQLNEVSYHQALVPNGLDRRGSLPAPAASSVFTGLSPEEPDSSQQMLEAAVYRACYDIGRRLMGEGAIVSADDLLGDKPFRQFLANCLHLAGEAGLAIYEDGGWALAADCALPAVSAILAAVGQERADRTVEVVAVNTVFRETLARLEALDGRMGHIAVEDDAAAGQFAVGEAILRHLEDHSPPARMRHALVAKALEAALGTFMAHGHAPRVVEIGTASKTLTADLAERVMRAGGCFAAIEPAEAMRRELAALFRGEPRVTIAGPSADLPYADIIVSAAGDLHGLMRADGVLRDMVKKLAAAGTRLVLCMPAPSPLTDFTMGLTEGWFEESQGVEFPIGSTASAADWKAFCHSLGVADPEPFVHVGAYGGIICMDGLSARTSNSEALPQRRRLVLHDRADILEPEEDMALALSGDLDADRENLLATLEELREAPPDIVY